VHLLILRHDFIYLIYLIVWLCTPMLCEPFCPTLILSANVQLPFTSFFCLFSPFTQRRNKKEQRTTRDAFSTFDHFFILWLPFFALIFWGKKAAKNPLAHFR